MVTFASTLLPYYLVAVPVIGVFIGTTKFSCFPILQYLSFFFIGLYCQKNNAFFNRKLWMFAFITTTAVTTMVLISHKIPDRFPPSPMWIIWAPFFTMCYYLLSRYLGRFMSNKKIKLLADVYGAYTLDYLVISNILIFTIRHFIGKTLTSLESFLYSAAILIVCFIYGYIKLGIRRNTRLKRIIA